MTNILEVFEYNQHFVAMMNIINAARLNPPVKGHKHHIIPRCWFKMMHLPVDNNKDNLVLLSYEDHCTVHKLALLCGKDKVIRSKLGWALKRLTFGHFLGCHHTEESKDKLSVAHKGKHHSEETLLKMSESHNGHSVSIETRRKLSASHKGKVMSAEARIKMSESHKGKSKTEFGKKFKEHYDITSCDNSKLYSKEYTYYANNGKCSWE